MMRKLGKLLFVSVLLVTLTFAFSTAVSAEYSGTCGENITWTLSDDGESFSPVSDLFEMNI